jgi:hypothetical protein
MCRSFEVISGKVNKGNVEYLKGICKAAVDAGKGVTILDIPVELMEIDTRYQTENRTRRDLRYLTSAWNESKLLPLVGVPHWEEGKVYLVDGYGRWIASQIVDKEKYKELKVMVLLNAPQDKAERLKYEAEMYAFQNKQVANMTPIQKHGAMLIMGDKATLKLEELRRKYGFEFVATSGKREAHVLGSYAETLDLCGRDNGNAADYVFEVLYKAGFDRKSNGYASYMIRGLRDMYLLYPDDRRDTKKTLVEMLRGLDGTHLRAEAVTKYPILDAKTAVSLYLEDKISGELCLDKMRRVENGKVVHIA